jgi:hypothetical protein
MAVTQISKIQVRRGRQENLPQLAAGELGWAIDTQQLYIGNGTFSEGAPSEGNTEILTALSNGAGAYATATLADNTGTATEFYSFNKLSYPAGTLRYSIVRNGVYRVGEIQYAYDGTVANTVSSNESYTGGSLGITITAVISGELIVFKYTASSTGYDGSVRYQRVDYF